MWYFLIALLLFLLIALLVWTRKPKNPNVKRYDRRGFDHNRIHKNGTRFDDFGFDYFGYDREGYNQQGYNSLGRNRKHQYNRLYDTKSCEEDGLLNIASNPIIVTTHAQDRMRERLGISDESKMHQLAFDAYRYGKSKRQIKKSSAWLIDELEQKHDNGVYLIYKGYIYIFNCENKLITLYKNDRITL